MGWSPSVKRSGKHRRPATYLQGFTRTWPCMKTCCACSPIKCRWSCTPPSGCRQNSHRTGSSALSFASNQGVYRRERCAPPELQLHEPDHFEKYGFTSVLSPNKSGGFGIDSCLLTSSLATNFSVHNLDKFECFGFGNPTTSPITSAIGYVNFRHVTGDRQLTETPPQKSSEASLNAAGLSLQPAATQSPACRCASAGQPVHGKSGWPFQVV